MRVIYRRGYKRKAGQKYICTLAARRVILAACVLALVFVSGCSALTASPVLPAETLVQRCYYRMFYQCSKLATVTCLATSGIGQSNSSTTNWLHRAGTEVQGAKTVYTVGTAEWPTGNNGIPSGWTRVNVDD